MKFSITCTDGVVINGDTSVGQEFKISKETGVLTFLDAPEGDKRSVVALSPSGWTKISYAQGPGKAMFL